MTREELEAGIRLLLLSSGNTEGMAEKVGKIMKLIDTYTSLRKVDLIQIIANKQFSVIDDELEKLKGSL